jgi:glycosyltransferase involved in cell wall biosynthesis
MNAVIYYYAKKYKVPYVLQGHGAVFPSKSFIKQVLGRILDSLFTYRLLRGASKVIALNQVEAEHYKYVGVPEEKIEIIPNGIDFSAYHDLPPQGSFKKKFGIEKDKIVLYMGRLHETKGLALLAHAFKTVSDMVSNVRLVVVGPDDGYSATFSKLIFDLGIEKKVLLTGFVDKKDKMSALVDSDVFITPFFWGFPLTFLEACLSGCPIVTASNELDWVNNNVGYVTEYSSDALAKGVISLLQDKKIHRKFRNNCIRMVEKFDLSTITNQLEKVYKEACSCGGY